MKFPNLNRTSNAAVKARIERARKQERDMVTEELTSKFDKIKHLMEKEYQMMEIEKDAEIKSLRATIQALQKTVFDAEEIYLKSVNMAKQSRRVLTDMVFHSEQGLNMSAVLHQSMTSLAATAEEHERTILAELEVDKKKLRQ